MVRAGVGRGEFGQWVVLHRNGRGQSGGGSAVVCYASFSHSDPRFTPGADRQGTAVSTGQGAADRSPGTEKGGVRALVGGDGPGSKGNLEGLAQSAGIGRAPTTSSWEFLLESAAWMLCGVLPEPPGLVFSPQALLAVKSVPVDEDPETEVPTHPEDGAPQPGNSKVSPTPESAWGDGSQLDWGAVRLVGRSGLGPGQVGADTCPVFTGVL